MSIGNLKDYGNKGNNFPYQLKSLEGLQCACDQLNKANGILTAIDGYTSLLPNILTNTNPNARTPAFLRELGTIFSNPTCYSISITSIGTGTAFVNGAALSANLTISFDAGSLNNYLLPGSLNIDTTALGAEVIITYVS